MKRKIGTSILALALSAGLLAGCGGSSGTPKASEAAAATAAGSTAIAETQGYDGKDNLQVSAQPITAKLFYAFGGNGAPKGDMPVWKEAARITNVTMENVANESIADDLQSFNTMLASGELPDLIQGLRVNLNPAISQGVFLPLNDLIDQYAPNLKKFFTDYPEAVNACSGTDGKIYCVTGTLGGSPGKSLPSMGFFLRQDWLDKLGLQVPTTMEEYKTVLYAFRNNDPNGNGKKDEIPFFYRDKGIWTILQLWNAHHEWYIGADDKVHHGKAEPEYKAALTELAQWYKDGVIDPEIFTRGSQARQFLLGNNIGGATVDWFASTGAMNDTVKAQVPAINFTAIAPPADINGKVKQNFSRDPIHPYAWGISKDCKDPVAMIKFMDFFMSETGTRLMGYGVEGQHYDLVNGQPVPNKEALSNPAGFPNFLRSIGGGYEIGYYGNLTGELNSMNKQAKEGFELYEKSDWLQTPFPGLSFNEEERKVLDANLTNLQANLDEYEQSCLMGAQSVDSSWDKHLETLNSMNLNAVLDAYNKAYERYKAAK